MKRKKKKYLCTWQLLYPDGVILVDHLHVSALNKMDARNQAMYYIINCKLSYSLDNVGAIDVEDERYIGG